MPEMFELEKKSIHIPAVNLYLDDRRKRNFGFVSHAHSDHLARHISILCTPVTARLAELRLKTTQYTELEFDRFLVINSHKIKLVPAGHVLGSAQIYIESENGSLLYTGDFRTKPSRTADKFRLQKADTVIMETTFGLPRYRFPKREEIEDQLLEIIKSKLETGIPVLVFAYTLGKAQEALHVISRAGLPVAVEYNILRYAKIYEKFGIRFGPYEKFKRSEYRDKVIILPSQYARQRYVASLPQTFKIYLSGWGMDESAKYRLGVDVVLPFSDHADFDELIEFAAGTGARTIYCTHGFDDFVTVLRREGINAKPLVPKAQLELFEA